MKDIPTAVLAVREAHVLFSNLGALMPEIEIDDYEELPGREIHATPNYLLIETRNKFDKRIHTRIEVRVDDRGSPTILVGVSNSGFPEATPAEAVTHAELLSLVAKTACRVEALLCKRIGDFVNPTEIREYMEARKVINDATESRRPKPSEDG